MSGMSASQNTSQSQQHSAQRCMNCGTVLPPTATFCGNCGKRLERPGQRTKKAIPKDRHVRLENHKITLSHNTNTSLDHNRSAENAGIQPTEINFTSDRDNNKTEQGKAGQTRLETHDTTNSIAPIPRQSVRPHLSRIDTHRPGQEPLKSEQEESILETGYSEQTMQGKKETIEQPEGEHSATAVNGVPGPEDGISSSDTSDNTASVSKDKPDTDNQSSKADTEEGESDTQTTVTDAEQNKQEPKDHTADSPESHEHIPPKEQSQADSSTTEEPTDSKNTSSSESNNLALNLESLSRDLVAANKTFSVLFEGIKRFVLGGQPRTNNAVAMIETPMRIQPNTNYTIRIHIMGRNEPKPAPGFMQNNNAAIMGGLGSLIHGEQIHIEVRSALYHNYAYIVQQTDVEVPAANYAAEITIPMRSITDSTGTKRERLHIFFTDQKQNPLYEKPFVIELFISNLVQSGHEGHNVLSITL